MSKLRIQGGILDSQVIVNDYVSPTICMDAMDGLAVQVNVTKNNPAAKVFTDTDVDPLEDTITISNHGFITGLSRDLSTSGVLPDGLSAGTYFVIVVDANTIKLAATYEDAIAGAAVAIVDDDGSGNHTLTDATSSVCSVSLQVSIDGINWQSTSNGTSVGDSGTVIENLVDRFERYARVKVSSVIGQPLITTYVNSKG